MQLVCCVHGKSHVLLSMLCCSGRFFTVVANPCAASYLCFYSVLSWSRLAACFLFSQLHTMLIKTTVHVLISHRLCCRLAQARFRQKRRVRYSGLLFYCACKCK